MQYPQLIKSVFHTQAGDKLRRQWDKMYRERLSFQPGMSPEEVAFREGQRSLVQEIEDMLTTEDEQ